MMIQRGVLCCFKHSCRSTNGTNRGCGSNISPTGTEGTSYRFKLGM